MLILTIAGEYKLIYTVEDSEGLVTTKERIITVKENLILQMIILIQIKLSRRRHCIL